MLNYVEFLSSIPYGDHPELGRFDCSEVAVCDQWFRQDVPGDKWMVYFMENPTKIDDLQFWPKMPVISTYL